MEHEPRRQSEREQEARLDRLETAITEIRDILKPISETYTTASTAGKWFMGLMVFISIGIGIVLSLSKLIHK